MQDRADAENYVVGESNPDLAPIRHIVSRARDGYYCHIWSASSRKHRIRLVRVEIPLRMGNHDHLAQRKQYGAIEQDMGIQIETVNQKARCNESIDRLLKPGWSRKTASPQSPESVDGELNTGLLGRINHLAYHV